jgi:thioesterase domain-containing protein
MKGFYMPTHYDGKAFVFASMGGNPKVCDPEKVWPRYLPNAKWIRVPGNHLSVLTGRHAVRLAQEISKCLKQVTDDPHYGIVGDSVLPRSPRA